MSILKVRDIVESVLDCDEILKVELKNDNVQSFNSRWNEAIIAKKKQPDKEFRIIFVSPSASTVRTAQAACCICTFKIKVTEVKREKNTRLRKRWWSGTRNRQFVRSVSLLVKDNLESPPLGLLQPWASPGGMKGQCSLEEKSVE